MPTQALEPLLVLLLTVLFLSLLLELGRFDDYSASPKASRYGPRLLRPGTPNDCPHWREVTAILSPERPWTVVPYAQRKSSRGRKKSITTCGQACPNPECDYYGITDAAIHALVGYGHHGRHEPIHASRFYCQACHPLREFSARRYTPLYRLRTSAGRVAQVLHAVAEGLSSQAAARVFHLSENTVRSWITRAGQHSQSLHNKFMRAMQVTSVQLDELRLKLRGATEAVWLWVACDARTKIIPAFALGLRTQALAHLLIHEVAARLAPGCLPIFSSDGLALYFYALTAHFGEWVQTVGTRRRVWTVAARLQYAQVIKHYRRRHITAISHRVQLGTPESYRHALCALGFSGRIQTAFVERLNLTIRRSIAGLARCSTSTAHSLGELTLLFEWWRAIYHFTRPHGSLRQAIGEQTVRLRYRPRTPAQAAGLTHRRWTVEELLTYPTPP